MPIPKIIYQTFKTKKLPLLTRWHISRFRKRNPDYDYQFYDDNRVEDFFATEFEPSVLRQYKKLNIGAAKADMFRYAILLKKGGVYLDIDSKIQGRLNSFISADDTAIISRERNAGLYVQWALIFAPKHPFLEKTLEKVLQNIILNKYPNDVHRMTGPSVFTEAVNQCIAENQNISYKLLGIDYDGHLKFKYPFSKFLYKKNDHWKKKQLLTPVLKG